MQSRQWVGPAGASLVHEAVRERWQTKYHQGFLDSWLKDWMEKGGHNAQGGSSRDEWKRHLWQGVRFAPLYALEEAPSALIEAAARSFKDQPLLATDLPGTSGMVLCEYPLPSLDVSEKPYDITAWMWTPGQDQNKRPGVVITLLTGNRDVAEPLRSAMPPHSMLHIHWLAFGDAPTKMEYVASGFSPVSDAVQQSNKAMLMYMQAFWSFVQQRVLVVGQAQHPRGVRKRAEKANLTLPALQVIRLRRADNGPVQPSDDPKHVDWRFRWVVSGHWRKWWFESEGRERQIWIADYIKGPDSKPLLKRKSVFAVER